MSKRGDFPPCNSCWCAECFVEIGKTHFPVKKTLDDDGEELYTDEGNTRFKQGRDGDHLTSPFQCELCHFRNIKKRNPEPALIKDNTLLEYLRRANLDILWSRETNTIRANVGSAKRIGKSEDKFGIDDIPPPMGPHPLEDTFGMKCAVAVLDRSLDPGKYDVYVQWATFRRTRSTITNISQAGASGLTDTVGAYEKNRMWISSVPTHSFPFSRFMEGAHRRVGEIVKRDEPVTIQVMVAIQDIIEAKWVTEMQKGPGKDLGKLRLISMMGLWYIGSFATGIRGEEMLLLEMAGTFASLKYLTEPGEGLPPHFEFVLSGRTKNNQVSGEKIGIPCVAATTGSGLLPGRWAFRYCQVCKALGYKGGRLFTMGRAQGKLFEFEDPFMEILEEVQTQRPDLIPPEVDVREDYGILRSLRRGSCAHATNLQIPQVLINAMNRWRQEYRRDVPKLQMSDHYSRLDALRPTILRYSGPY